MEGDPGEGIYRAMVEENGMPKLGNRATTLGIRLGIDIVADASGLVHRPAFNPGAANGLSCAPTIQSLPAFLLPVEWGGSNKRTVVWRLDEAELGSELTAQEDTVPGGRRHISIGPSGTMDSSDYSRAIEATCGKWTTVTPSGA